MTKPKAWPTTFDTIAILVWCAVLPPWRVRATVLAFLVTWIVDAIARQVLRATWRFWRGR